MDDSTVKIIVAILGSGLLTTIINRIFTLIDRRKEKDSAAIIGVRTLLKIEIDRLGKDYVTDGSITPEDLSDLQKMWEVYHETLGGNGYLDTIMSKIKALPLKT